MMKDLLMNDSDRGLKITTLATMRRALAREEKVMVKMQKNKMRRKRKKEKKKEKKIENRKSQERS